MLFAPAGADAPTRIYTARKILTMEQANPSATAVAVAGGRILAVGSLEEVKKTLADRPFDVDERFAGKVLMPGLIEQHLHRFWRRSASRSRSSRPRTGSCQAGPPRQPRTATNTLAGFARPTPCSPTQGISLHLGIPPALARTDLTQGAGRPQRYPPDCRLAPLVP